MKPAMEPDAQPAPSTASAGCDNGDPPALKPWEQHGGVINMPRYLYSSHAAPLLHRSGFFITCAFRKPSFLALSQVEREKSATKEAMEILHEFLSSSRLKTEEPDAKRARTSAHPVTPDVVEEGQTEEAPIEVEPGAKTTTEPGSSLDNAVESVKQQEFHLVKLARNGMVYISIPRRAPADLVTFFANTIHAFHSRSRPAPRWCHRIFPVQATCLWTKEDVRSSVVVLAKEFLEGHTATVSGDNPLKYAVAVNRRGLEEKEKPVGVGAALGKMESIHTVAEAIQSLTPHVSVNLTNPQMVVILEVLPLVRVESCVCAVSVLPRELVLTKPKLVIQGLAPPKQQKQKK